MDVIARIFLITLSSGVGLLQTTGFKPLPVDTRSLEPQGEAPIYYSIFVPENYTPSKAVPLVLALHFGGDPEGAGRAVLEMLIAPGLSELGAVIVSPDSKGGGWNSPANEHAINLLMDDTFKNFNIDRKKVAVTGFSMGGTGAWFYGMKYPDRFSAVIPISGTPPESSAKWQLPVLAIHSSDDRVVPIGPTRTFIAALRKNGFPADIVELSGVAHHQTYRYVDGLRQAVPWLKQVWE